MRNITVKVIKRCWARSQTGAHMKNLSQLAMTPPHELTIQEILRDRIALQLAKQQRCDEIELENQAAYRNRTINDRSQQGRNRRRAR